MLKKFFNFRITEQYRYHIVFLGIKIKFINPLYRNSFLQYKDWVNFIEEVNGTQYANKQTCLYILRDKRILLKRLGSKLGREFLDISASTYEDFVNFTERHPKFVAKIVDGAFGNNIHVYDLKNNVQNLENLYKNLLSNKTILLEEYINQVEELNQINPNSVSLVRICTLNINNSIDIASTPLLRIGLNEDKTNNRAAMVTQINNETGITEGISILYKYGKVNFQHKNIHPYKNICIKNFSIPYFEEVKSLAIECAKLVPEVKYIGWDIAITNKGPVVIEGNGGPMSYADEQLLSIKEKSEGVKNYYSKLKEYYNFKKYPNIEKIENITKKLYIENSNLYSNPDFIVILGSSKCAYRAKLAAEKYNDKENLIFIVSGGNKHHGISEYITMSDILKKSGIKQSSILEDRKSKYTKQNIVNSFKLINKHNKGVKKPVVDIITSGFHTKRVQDILNESGYLNKYKINLISAYGKHTSKENWYKTFEGYRIITEEFAKIKT